jgi:hypothetical protein
VVFPDGGGGAAKGRPLFFLLPPPCAGGLAAPAGSPPAFSPSSPPFRWNLRRPIPPSDAAVRPRRVTPAAWPWSGRPRARGRAHSVPVSPIGASDSAGLPSLPFAFVLVVDVAADRSSSGMGAGRAPRALPDWVTIGGVLMMRQMVGWMRERRWLGCTAVGWIGRGRWGPLAAGDDARWLTRRRRRRRGVPFGRGPGRPGWGSGGRGRLRRRRGRLRARGRSGSSPPGVR